MEDADVFPEALSFGDNNIEKFVTCAGLELKTLKFFEKVPAVIIRDEINEGVSAVFLSLEVHGKIEVVKRLTKSILV